MLCRTVISNALKPAADTYGNFMGYEFESIWIAREQAIKHLGTRASEKADLIAKLFGLLDQCILALESKSSESYAAELYGLTALKAKNLSVGSLSLVLDGLGQESGALMRPLIEYTELLIYLRYKPDAVDNIRAGRKLPSAGKRAKEVHSIYKDFRQHLNSHASHSAYSTYSLSHLIEPTTKRWRLFQPNAPAVLERNLADLGVQVYIMLREVLWCIHEQDEAKFYELAAIYDGLKPRLFHVFSLNDRLPGDNGAI